MLVKCLKDCPEIVANDDSRLRELLHPANDGVNPGFSVAYAVVEPGGATVPHRLKTSTEVYYVIDGRATVHVGDEVRAVEPGCVVHIPPGTVQWVENTGDIPFRFLCIVSPPWRADDDERVG